MKLRISLETNINGIICSYISIMENEQFLMVLNSVCYHFILPFILADYRLFSYKQNEIKITFVFFFIFCLMKNIKQQLKSRYKNGIVGRLQLTYSFLITFTIIILRLAIEMRAQVCQFAFVFACRKLASAEAFKETEHECHKNGYFQFHFT